MGYGQFLRLSQFQLLFPAAISAGGNPRQNIRHPPGGSAEMVHHERHFPAPAGGIPRASKPGVPVPGADLGRGRGTAAGVQRVLHHVRRQRPQHLCRRVLLHVRLCPVCLLHRVLIPGLRNGSPPGFQRHPAGADRAVPSICIYSGADSGGLHVLCRSPGPLPAGSLPARLLPDGFLDIGAGRLPPSLHHTGLHDLAGVRERALCSGRCADRFCACCAAPGAGCYGEKRRCCARRAKRVCALMCRRHGRRSLPGAAVSGFRRQCLGDRPEPARPVGVPAGPRRRAENPALRASRCSPCRPVERCGNAGGPPGRGSGIWFVGPGGGINLFLHLCPFFACPVEPVCRAGRAQ